MNLLFFFFKQKTAYEMRISDWSSDVCSSDLIGAHAVEAARQRAQVLVDAFRTDRCAGIERCFARLAEWCIGHAGDPRGRRIRQRHRPADRPPPVRAGQCQRSEEHTSELQSLMRISYAVFCLKKKKYYKN